MQSGFTGASDLYGAGRSMANPSQQTTSRPQIPASSSQMAHQIPSSLLGKRNLSDLHPHNQHNLNTLFLRSVKPRAFPPQNMEFFSTMSLPAPEVRLFSGTTAGVLLHQLRQHQIPAPAPFSESPEKKMMDHRLQELEKQLLEDDESDSVSVITNSNSEWCETMYNLISPSPSPTPSQNLVSSSSPTSSSSSSSSSPASDCWKQSVMEAAAAISEGKVEAVDEILAAVSKISNARGNSMQRLMEYVVTALKSRANPSENPPPVTELYGPEHASATQLLYDVSPCFKLAFMAANLAILDGIGQDGPAGQGNPGKFHVVDFDIGQGGQYMNLLHVLSAPSRKGKVGVRLTTVAENGDDEKLRMVGESLTQLAERVGVGFEFNVVSQKLTELTRESLGCELNEPLAVNFAFKLYRVPDESVSTENPRDELLRRVKRWAPAVVTVMEQEMNMNTAPFVTRVAESCSYYGSLFDSVESTVQRDHPDRVRVEEGLGRKLANSLACEGRDRVERCELSGKWRARMGMAGFESKPLSQTIAESMRTRLSSGYRVNPGFTVKEENGGICFGWMGRTLTVASAWR